MIHICETLHIAEWKKDGVQRSDHHHSQSQPDTDLVKKKLQMQWIPTDVIEFIRKGLERSHVSFQSTSRNSHMRSLTGKHFYYQTGWVLDIVKRAVPLIRIDLAETEDEASVEAIIDFGITQSFVGRDSTYAKLLERYGRPSLTKHGKTLQQVVLLSLIHI